MSEAPLNDNSLLRPELGPAEPRAADAFEFGVWLERVAGRWKRHLAATMVAAVVMYGLTFLMPSWYKSTAVLLPPEETDDLSASMPLQRFLSRVPSLTGITRYYTPSDVYKAILTSRTVETVVIERFGMQKLYRTKSLEKTVKEFRRHLGVSLAPDGTITVTFEDRSRERAAQIANGLIEELDRFNVEKRNSQAKRARIFLEERVADTDSLQRLAESLLRTYQEQHHVVAPPEVEGANLGPLADVMARKMALEVRLGVLRTYLQPDNEQVVQVSTELEKIKNQLAALPQVETEIGRLIRDVRLYQQVYLLLSAQLEDARLREAMDTPTVTVLDRAVPSERRAKPIRWLWVAMAAAVAFVASTVWSDRPRPVPYAIPGSLRG